MATANMHCLVVGPEGSPRKRTAGKWLTAGLEVGSIQHVPSTSDLINQLQEAGLPVPSRASLRRRTSSFFGSLENLHALGQEAAASDTPRSQDDASAFTSFLSDA